MSRQPKMHRLQPHHDPSRPLITPKPTRSSFCNSPLGRGSSLCQLLRTFMTSVAVAGNGKVCGAAAYSYRSRGMHCRAARSGAPILRAVWRQGCPAAHATAADAARDRARGAGSRPRRRRSGAAGSKPCAGNSAIRRTRRNSGAAATPSRPRGGVRTRRSSASARVSGPP